MAVPSAPLGRVEPGLEPVAEAFAATLPAEGPGGAALAVYRHGRPIVDLCGGTTDAGGRPWRRDTLVHVFSATKPFAAVCVLLLHDRGLLDLDASVADTWPEFAAAGKGETTVRALLAHQAGLVALAEPQPADVLLDWERLVAILAAEEPAWPPGSSHGEHALFYGHLLGELVRRSDGRTLGAFLRDELARPWALDFHVGVAADDLDRVATLVGPPGGFREARLAGASPLLRRALDNPPGLLDLEVLNGRAWRRAEVPAVNGHGSAVGVARLYAGLAAGGILDGVRLLRPETVAEAVRPARRGPDELLGRDVAWGLGFQVDEVGFGMGGIGGSLGWGDARRGLGFAYVTSVLDGHERALAVEQALLARLA